MIDVFSKYALAIPVYFKEAKAIPAVFGKVLTAANPRYPRRLQNKKGKKFVNADFQALMKRHGIQHFAYEREQKVAVKEQFNRTIKTRI